MIFSIVLVILLIFIFFWALQCHKQSEYEYYQNQNTNNNEDEDEEEEDTQTNTNNLILTNEQIKAGAAVIGGVLGMDVNSIEDKLSNAGNNVKNVFKEILTNTK